MPECLSCCLQTQCTHAFCNDAYRLESKVWLDGWAHVCSVCMFCSTSVCTACGGAVVAQAQCPIACTHPMCCPMIDAGNLLCTHADSRVRSGLRTGHTMEAMRDCVGQFLKKMPAQTCANCGCHNPTLRRWVLQPLHMLCHVRLCTV